MLGRFMLQDNRLTSSLPTISSLTSHDHLPPVLQLDIRCPLQAPGLCRPSAHIPSAWKAPPVLPVSQTRPLLEGSVTAPSYTDALIVLFLDEKLAVLALSQSKWDCDL